MNFIDYVDFVLIIVKNKYKFEYVLFKKNYRYMY